MMPPVNSTLGMTLASSVRVSPENWTNPAPPKLGVGPAVKSPAAKLTTAPPSARNCPPRKPPPLNSMVPT